MDRIDVERGRQEQGWTMRDGHDKTGLRVSDWTRQVIGYRQNGDKL